MPSYIISLIFNAPKHEKLLSCCPVHSILIHIPKNTVVSHRMKLLCHLQNKCSHKMHKLHYLFMVRSEILFFYVFLNTICVTILPSLPPNLNVGVGMSACFVNFVAKLVHSSSSVQLHDVSISRPFSAVILCKWLM